MRRLLTLVLLLMSLSVAAKTVNPLDYGLRTAKTGEERYYALKRCHEDAVKHGYNISYKGIREIQISVSQDAVILPLPDVTDFAGVRIVMDNKTKNFRMFQLQGTCELIEGVTGKIIDRGDYTSIEKLATGLKFVYLEDENPWINTRLGYNSTAVYKRKDIIVVKNGRAQNQPIMPYNNANSQPKVWYSSVMGRKKVIKNLEFVRTAGSTFISTPLALRFMYNVVISNITVTTPKESKLDRGDGCFIIEDCARITMNDIKIDGTYSTPKLTGYGVRLLNVYDMRINRMNAHGGWGIFGNYNVNKAMLKDCDINRFDIHYYGCDIRSEDCIYRDLYNQFASVYGEVSFKNCEFINTIPVLMESSFNAYTPFELVWQNCTFHLTKQKNYLITLFGVPQPYNDRPELRRKCLPNITLKNCTVYLDDDVEKWQVVRTQGVAYKDSFDYITDVNINNVRVISKNEKPFEMYSEELKTTKPVKVKLKKFNH